MTGQRTSASNPFSTRFVRPGAIAFQFAQESAFDELLARLEQNNRGGEIVGPHGSGKSTLLARLAAALEANGISAVLITLHEGERQLPRGALPQDSIDAPQVVLVDGCEQLGRWQRGSLVRHCRRRGWGLIVTTHQSLGLPALYTTTTDVALATELARQLQNGQLFPVTGEDVASAFAAHHGNLREVLFDLYDRYERYRASGRAP